MREALAAAAAWRDGLGDLPDLSRVAVGGDGALGVARRLAAAGIDVALIEVDEDDARTLVENGLEVLCEGANMPTVPGGVNLFVDQGILYGPGKAANAGGVAVSGLEMAQNSMRIKWPREEVDQRLKMIMKSWIAKIVPVKHRKQAQRKVPRKKSLIFLILGKTIKSLP